MLAVGVTGTIMYAREAGEMDFFHIVQLASLGNFMDIILINILGLGHQQLRLCSQR